MITKLASGRGTFYAWDRVETTLYFGEHIKLTRVRYRDGSNKNSGYVLRFPFRGRRFLLKTWRPI